MKRPYRLISCICALFSPSLARAQALCPGVATFEIAGELQPPLTATEKRLVCGDPTETGGRSEGWKTIPKNQALYNLQNFLQSRGYLNPSIVERENGGVTVVKPGQKVRVSAIEVKGAPPFVDVTRMRRVLGEPLNREQLDATESWVHHELARGGYPCADIRIAGDPQSGKVALQVDPGAPLKVHQIEVTHAEPLNLEVLRRFDAFDPGAPYNSDLLAISADRAITDGVVERTFFVPVCGKGNDTVRQDVVLGQARVFTLGVSLNTEEVSVGRLSLKRVRLGDRASSVTAEARASFKVQQLTASLDWRPAALASRSSVRPLVSIRHENENPFEVYTERAQLSFAHQWDFGGLGIGLVVGPEVESFYSRRGQGASHAHAVALNGELRLISHEYEFNRVKLSGGYHFTMNANWSREGWLSNFGATRLRFKGETVWNVGGFDPPALLVGFRAGYGAIVPQGNRAALPAHYQEYLGGLADLRGFSRMELAANGASDQLGALGGRSSAFAGVELRPDLFGGELEPIAFVDVGALGAQDYLPSGTLYWSPGIGVSWNTPVGPVRGTIAHGFVAGGEAAVKDVVSHWQVYLTLGEPL